MQLNPTEGGSVMKAFSLLLAVFALAIPATFSSADESAPVTWSYEGEGGPLHWGHLGPEFALCDKGMAQSPIDLLRAHKLDLAKIEFSYKDAPFHVINNGHTLEELEPLAESVQSRYPQHGQTVLHFDKDSTIVFDDDLYLLEQFHFHAPSEHTVDHKHYPMELHLVHHNERHEAAVVAVFMKEGKHNDYFETFLDHAPQKVGEFIEDQKHVINPKDLLPKNLTYYRYFGSYTTPPCHEGVIWAVMHDPIEVSAEQIHRFRTLLGHENARPTQPVHKRFVLESSYFNTAAQLK
jgi:carbonic anhydrase